MQKKLSAMKTRRFPWPIVIAVLLLVVLLAGWLLMENHRKLEEMRAEENELRVELSTSQKEEESLQLKLSNVSSSSTIDSEARSMSFMKPGELRFEVVDADLLDKYTEDEWNFMMTARKLGVY